MRQKSETILWWFSNGVNEMLNNLTFYVDFVLPYPYTLKTGLKECIVPLSLLVFYTVGNSVTKFKCEFIQSSDNICHVYCKTGSQ